MQPIKKLVFITTAQRLEDGGMATLSRLIAVVAQDYCRSHDLEYEVLDLGLPTDLLPGIPIRYFQRNQLTLALAIWKRVLTSRQTAYIFIHIGPARAMGVLPEFLIPPYMVFLVGAELWRTFTWERRRALKNAVLLPSISAYTERRTRDDHHPWLPPALVLLLSLEERPITDEIDQTVLNQLGPQTILIVGRLDPTERYKGHDELLEVMPAILRQCPQAQLVITGRGADLLRLQAKAVELGVSSQVIFTGFVSDATLQALYAQCRVFTMPSRGEGFGLVLLEAMKAGRPCVALRDSPAAEIIEDGVTGILVDYGDADQLTDALVRLLQDEAYSNQLGAAGHKRWSEQFTKPVFQANFYRYLDQLCRRAAKAGNP